MPVYDLTYRSYEGSVRRHFRWAVIAAQETKVLLRLRPLQVILLAPLFHAFLRVLQVISYDSLAADPRSPLSMAVRNATLLNVDNRMFFDFLRFQGAFLFVALLMAGAGMIANDARHNLLEVYFSKPLTWRDYVLGKCATLIGLGLALTAVPALLCVLLHVLLVPSLDTLVQGAKWVLPIVAFSLAVVVPLSLAVLACSAVFRSERTAALACTLLLFVNWIFGNVLADLLHQRNVLILSIPTAIRRMGEILFDQHRWSMQLPMSVAVLVVGGVCAVSLALIVRTARRAEGNA